MNSGSSNIQLNKLMQTKLQEFIKRNRKRNSHLYKEDLQEGYDYVVCPISKERMSMIKNSYIANVLGMRIEDYPIVRRTCQKRKENIKSGLKQIDSATGLSKYELSQVKARNILKQIDSSGMSGYAKKGQKTRATHMSKIDDLGRNGYSRLASKAILKGNTTKASKGLISLNRNEFKRYKTVVLYLTEKLRQQLTHGYVTGLAGKADAWHIDHKFSILKGFQEKISPFVIGHKSNLQMIPWRDNISKHSSCSIDLVELYFSCGYTKEQSTAEFNLVMEIINKDIDSNTPPNAAFLIERFYGATLRD